MIDVSGVNPYLLITILLIMSYLAGSIPSAYLAGKSQGLDIRQHGSGNVGATNTFRILGKKWGIIVLVADALKAFFPVLIIGFLVSAWLPPVRLVHVQMMAGFFAILGHTFPVWLKFKGGKGVACGLGVMLALAPASVLLALVVFLVTVALTKYMSLGSILAAISLPIFFALIRSVRDNLELFLFIILVVIFVVYKHKSNIVRLFRGEETKITSFSKS